VNVNARVTGQTHLTAVVSDSAIYVPELRKFNNLTHSLHALLLSLGFHGESVGTRRLDY
jgi:hypothetical protein